MTRRTPTSFDTNSKGPTLWRSLEEKRESAVAKASRAAAEFETPLTTLDRVGPRAADLIEPHAMLGRRSFLGATTVATASLSFAGCLRRPKENILPFSRAPEYVVPGVPLHFATVTERRGDAIGLLVTSHEGRPTKIEGNPLHPSSLGATDALAQASILGLYDPDRARQPSETEGEHRHARTYEDFERAFEALIAKARGQRGRGLRVVMPPTNSPSVLRMRARVLAALPEARFHSWAPVHEHNAREGARMVFDRPLSTVVDYSKARIIVAVDSDFLSTEAGAVRAARDFAAGRTPETPAADMNRLYVVESTFSLTGANADHRLRVASSRVGAYLLAVARELATRHGVALGGFAGTAQAARSEGIPPQWVAEVARDLASNRQRAVIVVGSRQPPVVHALAHVLNRALGAVAHGGDRGALTGVVRYHEVHDPSERSPVVEIAELAQDLRAKKVDTLVLLGVNPVYDAPGEVGFAEALTASTAKSISFSSHVDETAQLTSWHVPMAHDLESWGDQRALDGTVSIQQPLIDAMFGGRNPLSVLAALEGGASQDAYSIVRETARGLAPVGVFERSFRAALQSGTLPLAESASGGIPVESLPFSEERLAALRFDVAAEPSRDSVEVVFAVDNRVFDGRYLNNPWLLELPDPINKVVWDNAAHVSRATAAAFGLVDGDLVRIEVDGRSIEIAVATVPGQADYSVTLPLGWGRFFAGRYACHRDDRAVGFDVYPLRGSATYDFAVGAKLTRTGRNYTEVDAGRYNYAPNSALVPKVGLVRTQTHGSMEGRPIAIDATLDEYRAQPDFAAWRTVEFSVPPLWKEVDYLGPTTGAGLRAWRREKSLTEAEAAEAIFGDRGQAARITALESNPEAALDPVVRKALRPYRWGMTIDLSSCTGCNTCTVACQAENNIPVVGKREVFRGREMTWIRIDRYFVGDDEDAPMVAMQPVACQQCEEAPCENVCPVSATAHSPEGLNDMAYNRCIGTRYCANNCPYKVRRFNYLNWHENAEPTHAVPETRKMQFNPNVTVRMRGVMEKCTYCVQRIQSAKILAKRENRRVRDGEIQVACQQACPSSCISFGDLNDPDALVSKLASRDRHYKLLAEIGAQPRTTYLGKIRNVNPAMAPAATAGAARAAGTEAEG